MKKATFIICMVLTFAITASAHGATPLCQFPFGYNSTTKNSGSFFIQFDSRFYDDSYAVESNRPNGGIKFGFELGYYIDDVTRQKAVVKLNSITYTNLTNESTFKLVSPAKYRYVGAIGTDFIADYVLTFGNSANAIGDWKIEVIYDGVTYDALFSVTDEMINTDNNAPIPVEVRIKRDNNKNFKLCFTNSTPDASQYRVRIIDGQDIVKDTKLSPPFVVTNGYICDPTDYLPTYAGKSGRVEARYVSGDWLQLLTRQINIYKPKAI
jgi:hypothetical protein